MKRKILSVLLLTILFILSGCDGQNPVTASPSEPSPIETTTSVSTESSQAEDQASLITQLQSAGATVEIGESVIQDFFTPEGVIISINGQDVQVFEYKDAASMESEASLVAPDGGSVGTSMMMWMNAPHFYKAGRIIVLYVGSDNTTLKSLDETLGPQFAGQ